MAVVDTNSTTITNLEASPPVMTAAITNHGVVRRVSETVAIAAADDDTSTYRFFRVHSSWSILSLKIVNEAITGGTDYDLGLYSTAGAGGAVVDADLYADGITLATAAPPVPPTAAAPDGIECRFGDATTAVPGDVNNRVWQDLGLAADPGLWYDMVLTSVTVGSAAGNVSLICLYTDGT